MNTRAGPQRQEAAVPGGVLHVHSAAPGLCPRIERAVAAITGADATMTWAAQPAERGTFCAELAFHATPGAAAAITSKLGTWDRLRFEVTEQPSPGCDGVRYSHTPALGTFTAVTGANGDLLIHEHRVRAVLAAASAGALAGEVAALLGQAWDDELEPFRRAGAGAAVRRLTAVG
jgi:hypothetical protein